MFDELNEVVEQVAQQDQPTNEPSQEQIQESKRDANARALREKAEYAERRVRELEYQLQQNMLHQKGNKIQLVEEDDEDDFHIENDKYVEGKDLNEFKKYVKKIKQENKQIKQQFSEYAQKNEESQAELRWRTRFNDFEAVVNKENLHKLQMQKPELFSIITSSSSALYDKGLAAYEFIKNSGILNNDYEDIDRRIDQNKQKPRSASTVAPKHSESPLSTVGNFGRRVYTDAQKDEILRQSNAKIMNM
jgi:hypothetical protein